MIAVSARWFLSLALIRHTGKVWLPEIIRNRPRRRFELKWSVPVEADPLDPQTTVPEGLRRSGVELTGESRASWTVVVPWQTLVYGFIRRDVDETATLTLVRSEAHWELRLDCLPAETHGAHAAGAAGALAMAAATWVIGGWTGGILPGLTVLAGAGLWTDATRVMALSALESRIRLLITDLGLELWPDSPAELLPPLQ